MSEICVFAGTTEGRRLVDFLAGQPVGVRVCVATEYGGELVKRGGNIRVSAGRLDGDAMRAMFDAEKFDAVIDATHPFATLASATIAAACAESGVEYLRLERDADDPDADAVYVDSIHAAAEFLAGHPGRALLTTGSKSLEPYARVDDYRGRFYVRVLPTQASLAACEAAGFAPGHVIAMQGPFSVEMNVATLKAIGADWLVTKESGANGGFEAKLEAARLAGARCVVIGRPEPPKGLSFSDLAARLEERFGLKSARCVAVVGIGLGGRQTMTLEADAALRDCDCVIGAKRMLEAAAHYGKPAFEAIQPGRIVEIMNAHPEYRRFAVAMSGDPGFFSGAKKLLPLLGGCDVRVIPGLSSLQALCARAQTGWEDVKAVSLHGREGSAAADLKRYGRVFALLDGADAVARVCEDLCGAGMGEARLTVGERLSYPDERLTRGSAAELKEYACEPLSAVLIEYPTEVGHLSVGLPDDAFLRETGEKQVPMTKSEVRAVSLSKLRLTEDAVAFDIGAGTGSVSVEMALNCPKGRVFAVECREDAAALIERNRKKFALRNLTVVQGNAPEALEGLPVPTHAFIGGTGGSMSAIVRALLAMNPDVRIVVNAVTLESAGEIAAIIRECGFADAEVVQLNVARRRAAGPYSLMTGQNPVTIAALQRGKEMNDEDRA